METRLDQDRKKIDEIDQQLVKLFEARFKVVEDVIDYKIENHLPILDQGRENVILEKNCNRIENDDIRPYFEKWYREMLKLSKEYQQQVLDEK